jgi:hypothetical protein
MLKSDAPTAIVTPTDLSSRNVLRVIKLMSHLVTDDVQVALSYVMQIECGVGTIVDATIMAAPSSTENEKEAHGPEVGLTAMTRSGIRHQAPYRRGQQNRADPRDDDDCSECA